MTGLGRADHENDRGTSTAGRVRRAVHDSWVEAGRHLRIMPRNPEMLLIAVAQPVMFVLLFSVVFGEAIAVPGFDDYHQFLIPGILVQGIVFGSTFTSVGIAEDMQKGFIDRLRTLPISRAAVPIGRTLSDLARSVLTFAATLVVAFLIGFRFSGSVPDVVAATALILGFGYALSWVQAFVGVSVDSVEAASAAGSIWMFPLTFVSSAFVDPGQMPSWLQPVARNNPFTIVIDASRALFNGVPVGSSVWLTIVWSVGIAVVFATLSIRRFGRSTTA